MSFSRNIEGPQIGIHVSERHLEGEMPAEQPGVLMNEIRSNKCCCKQVMPMKPGERKRGNRPNGTEKNPILEGGYNLQHDQVPQSCRRLGVLGHSQVRNFLISD